MMTPEQDHKLKDLRWRQERLAIGLQRIVDALGNDAFDALMGFRSAEDQPEKVAAYERTLARMDELLAEEEKILIEAGILSGAKDDTPPEA